MACDLNKIKEDSLREVQREFIGYAKYYKKIGNNHLFLNNNNYSKGVAQKVVDGGIQRVTKWATKKFGNKYSNNWIETRKFNNGIEVILKFPKNLEASYISKIENKPFSTSFEEVKDLGDNVFEVDGDIYPTREDAEYILSDKQEVPRSYDSLDYSPEFESEIKDSDKGRLAFIDLPILLTNKITGEPATSELVHNVIYVYNRKYKLDKNNIPDYKDTSVLNDLKLITGEIRERTTDILSNNILQNNSKKTKRLLNDVINNNKKLRDFKGSYKYLVRNLKDFIDLKLDDVRKIDNIIKTYQKDISKKDNISELNRRKSKIEAEISQMQEVFDHLTENNKIQDLNAILPEIKKQFLKINDSFNRIEYSDEIDIDEMTTSHYLLEYFTKIFNDPALLQYEIFDEFIKVDLNTKNILKVNNKYVILDDATTDPNGRTVQEVIAELQVRQSNIQRKFLLEINKKYDKSITYDDIEKEVKDLTYARYQLLSLDMSERAIDQGLAFLIDSARIKASSDVNQKSLKIDDLLEKILKKINKKEFRDLFFRKSHNGALESNSLAIEFTQKYFDDRKSKIDALDEEIQDISASKIDHTEKNARYVDIAKRKRKVYNEVQIHLDLSIVFADKFKDIDYITHKNPTQQEIDNELKRVEKYLGKEKLNELLEKQEKEIDSYLELRRISLENSYQKIGDIDLLEDAKKEFEDIKQIDGVLYGIHKIDKSKFLAEDFKNNPLLYNNWLVYNTPFDYKGINTYSTERFLVLLPKKYDDNGNDLGFYDSNYDIIQKDPLYKELYNLWIEEQKTYYKNSSYDQIKDIRYNQVTGISKRFFESVLETRMFGQVFKIFPFLKSFLTNTNGLGDNFAKLARLYGVNSDTYNSDSIKKIHNNFDFGNKKEIDSKYLILEAELKLELLKLGKSNEEINDELKKRSQELRDQIIHNMISSQTDDPRVTIKSLVNINAELKWKNQILPYMRMYEKGLEAYSKGDKSTIVDVNESGNIKKDSKGNSIKKDSEKYIQKAKNTIRKFYNESIDGPTIKGTQKKIELKLEEPDSWYKRTRFTAEENKKIDEIRDLYNKYEKAFQKNEITKDQFDTEKAKLLVELEKYSIYNYGVGDVLLRRSLAIQVFRSLGYNQVNSIYNRLGGILTNVIKASENRSYDLASYTKALKLISSHTSTSALGGAVLGSLAGTLITIPIIGSIPILMPLVGIFAGRQLGLTVGKYLQSKNPTVIKLTNIVANFDFFKWNEIIADQNSLEAKILKPLESLKPMTTMKDTEFANAAEQIAAFLYYMKPKVVINGETVELKDGFELFNPDGSLKDFEGYQDYITDNMITKEELFEKIGRNGTYLISTNTGQYDPNKPIEITKTPVGTSLAMFRKWWFNSTYDYFAYDEIKHRGVSDLVNKKDYTILKGKIKTLQDTFGTATGSSIAGLYSLGSVPFQAGAALSILGILSVSTGVVGLGIGGTIAAVSYFNKKKYNKENNYDNKFSEYRDLLSLMPYFGYKYETGKIAKGKGKEFFDNLSIEDKANIRNMRTRFSILSIELALVVLLKNLIESTNDDEDDDEKDIDVAKIFRFLKNVVGMSAQNAYGALTYDSLVRDIKNNGGSNVAFNSVKDFSNIISLSIGETIYPFIPEGETKDYLKKKIKYTTNNKKYDYKKGDSKLLKQLERAVPLLKVQEQIRGLTDKEDNEKTNK